MRKLKIMGLLAGLAAFAALTAIPAGGKVPGPNGRIAFARFDPAAGGTLIQTVNPDGSRLRQLFSRPAEWPHWSPDGSAVSIFCCDDGMAAHIVDTDSGDFRELAPPDPTLETHCGPWSPDGKRLTCESFGSTDPGRNGIYTIRSSDGGGLTRITSNPGGDDIPGDYSPDGKHLVFVRSNENGPLGIFVTRTNGSGLRRITPSGMLLDELFGGSWSPAGDSILFVARNAEDHHLAIWVVHADGSGLHQLPITPSCGGALSDPKSTTCRDPGWSPDGTKIVFTRVSANGTQANIHTVNANGSGLFQVTTSGGAGQPNWGPHRLIP